MKRIVLILFLLISNMVSAQMVDDWIFIEPDVAVNPLKVKYYKDGTMEIWTRYYYDNGGIKRVSLNIYDIDNERASLLQTIGYDKSGNVESASDYYDDLDWSRIVPGTVGEDILKAAKAIKYMDWAYETLLSIKPKVDMPDKAISSYYDFKGSRDRSVFKTDIINGCFVENVDPFLALFVGIMNRYVYGVNDYSKDDFIIKNIGCDLWCIKEGTVLTSIDKRIK